MAGFTTFPLEGQDKEQVLEPHIHFSKNNVFSNELGCWLVVQQVQLVQVCPAPPAGPLVPGTKDGLSELLQMIRADPERLCSVTMCHRTFQRLSWTRQVSPRLCGTLKNTVGTCRTVIDPARLYRTLKDCGGL